VSRGGMRLTWPRSATAQGANSGGISVRRAVGRIGFYTFVAVVTAFFALPMLWLATAPFDATPGLTPSIPDATLRNFRALRANPYALESLWNSVVLSAGTVVLAVLC